MVLSPESLAPNLNSKFCSESERFGKGEFIRIWSDFSKNRLFVNSVWKRELFPWTIWAFPTSSLDELLTK
jgi:hypothetical protein